MLDIGFSELLVIGGVALVVLGPEKLAVVARATGKWAGKAQRYVNDVKADIAREGELAELRKLKSEMELAGNDLKQSLQSTQAEVNADLAAIESQAKLDSSAIIDIQASLDSTSQLGMPQENSIFPGSYTPPAIDMTGNFHAANVSALEVPSDPMSLQMELIVLNDDLTDLQKRMDTLHAQLREARIQAQQHLDAATPSPSTQLVANHTLVTESKPSVNSNQSHLL